MPTTSSGLTYPNSSSPVTPSADIQQLAEDIEDIALKIPLCEVFTSGNQTIEEGLTGEEIQWDGTESVDTHGFHSSGNYFRITPNVAGWYWVYCNLVWDVGNAGYRRCFLKKNGTRVAAGLGGPFSDSYGVSSYNAKLLSANGSGDYFTVEASQNGSGQSIDIIGGTSSFGSVFGVMWVRPL